MIRPSRCRVVTAPRRALTVCAALLAFALAGCGSRSVPAPVVSPQAVQSPSESAPAPAAPQTIAPGEAAASGEPASHGAQVKIALLLPLSGPNGGLGHALLDAAQMALFDVGDNDLVLLPRDTQGTADGAASAAQAVLAESPALILGPLLAPEVEAVKPLAKQANVNMVAFSTAEQLAGDGTFLLSFLARQNVERIVAFAHGRGATRFAALAPSTPYGELVVSDLRAATAAIGASFDHVEMYDPAANDLRPVVRRLAQFDERTAALAHQRAQLEDRKSVV